MDKGKLKYNVVRKQHILLPRVSNMPHQESIDMDYMNYLFMTSTIVGVKSRKRLREVRTIPISKQDMQGVPASAPPTKYIRCDSGE